MEIRAKINDELVRVKLAALINKEVKELDVKTKEEVQGEE